MTNTVGYCFVCKRFCRVTFERIAFVGGRSTDAGTCAPCAKKALAR